jgi:predicted PurR-regulated permease PerM
MKLIFTNSQLKQLFFLVIILGLSFVIFKELIFFLPSFLGALTLYILTQRFYKYLVFNRKWKSWLASLVIMLAAFCALIIPIWIFINLVFLKIDNASLYVEKINVSTQFVLKYFKDNFQIDLLGSDILKSASGFLAENVSKIINSSLNILTTIFTSFFIFYFMLSNSTWLENRLFLWLPLKKTNTVKVRDKFFKMVVSNTIGIPVVALAQAIVGFIGYWIIGLEDIWFWFVITFFASAIPLVGSALAYIPISIIFFANNQYYEGIFILIWGSLVIGSIDNICRFTLLKKLDDVHPLITVFGIIVGLNVFGFLGLIFGPLLLSMLFLLIEIYRDEYSELVHHTSINKENS